MSPITSCFLFTSLITYFFGCPAESASTVENQLMPDPSTSRFTWSIENFFKRNVRKHYSDDFVVGGYKWRVLVFPRGNNTDHLSMYLDVADSHLLPPGWSRYAQFSLAVVNQLDSKMSIRKGISCYLSLARPDYTSLKCTVRSLVLLAILLACFLVFFMSTFIKYAIQHKLDSDYLWRQTLNFLYFQCFYAYKQV